MKEITFTEAASIILDNGGVITFKADNNRYPEQYGFEFEISDFEQLCEEYKQLYKNYTNIRLYA